MLVALAFPAPVLSGLCRGSSVRGLRARQGLGLASGNPGP